MFLTFLVLWSTNVFSKQNWNISVWNTGESHDPCHHWLPVCSGLSKHLMLTASSTFHAIPSNLFLFPGQNKPPPPSENTRLPGNRSERGLWAEVRDQQLLPLRTLHWCLAKEHKLTNTHTVAQVCGPHTDWKLVEGHNKKTAFAAEYGLNWAVTLQRVH